MAELGLSSPDSEKLAVVISLRDRMSLSVYSAVVSLLLKIEQLWL